MLGDDPHLLLLTSRSRTDEKWVEQGEKDHYVSLSKTTSLYLNDWVGKKRKATLKVKEELDKKLYDFREAFNSLKVFKEKAGQEIETTILQTEEVL